MAKHNIRVKIPRNAEHLLQLANTVYAKHMADAEKSPLNLLNDYNWQDNSLRMIQAQALQQQIRQTEKELDNLYRKRDTLLAPVNLTLKCSRDLLLGMYKANYKKLTEWGFEVDDTPKQKQPVTTNQ